MSPEDWDAQLDVNLKASFFLCRAIGQEMMSTGKGGRIITFASLGGLLAWPAASGSAA